jgi:hypothetical protein
MNDQYLADKIFNEFDRLEVSSHQEPYSGLMADHQSLLVEGRPDVVVVKIFDDSAHGLYDAHLVLDHLKALSPGDVDLDSESPLNIWQSIEAFALEDVWEQL